MSCMQSTKLRAAASVSKEIDRTLQQDKKRLHWELKVLLLGASESGKSTVMKQMKILHGEGYSEEECRHYKVAVYRGTIQAIKDVISSMERQGISFEDVVRAGDARQLLALATSIEDGVMSEDLAGVIRRLWGDAGVQASLGHSPEHQPSDTTSYYLHNLDRIYRADYIPTEQDVLRARVRTTGIQEMRFAFNDLNFRMIDASGQRFDSSKWFHCFECVDMIIFFVALSDYVEETHRIHESRKQFQNICRTAWFRKTPIIVLFTKKDLFEEKIHRIPLTTCFPEYSGANTYEKATNYFWHQFTDSERERSGMIYYHYVCATDTENTRLVFHAVSDLRFHKASLPV